MSDLERLKKEKFDTANRFLEEDYVLLHINPAVEDVELPDHLMCGPSVTLKLSRYFRGYMEVNKDNIVADLLFSGRYFTCIIPFNAVWGCTSEKGENVIWPESTPKEVLEDILMSVEKPAPARESSQSADDKQKNMKQKGHLRRIK